MEKKRTDQTVKITVIAAALVVVILILGTIWTGRSAQKDTVNAVRSVSSLYLDELAGRREQVVEDNLNNNINFIQIAVGMIEEDDLSDAEEDDEEEEVEETAPVRTRRRRESRSARERRPRPRRTPNITFDEELDYPEDADLMSFDNAGSTTDKADIAREQSSLDKGAASADESGYADEDFYADDDDDMEYSFLSSSSKRNRS